MVTDKEREEARDPGLLDRLGITDLESGLAKARTGLPLLWDGGKSALGADRDVYPFHIAVAGLLARAQGFHEGTVAAIEAGNPYAAFTLLRAYAENAAALIYLRDKPQAVRRILGEAGSHPIKSGVLTAYAARNGADGFAAVYETLSEYAHPAARSVYASHSIAEDDRRRLEWRSAPAFKSENDRLMACAWTFEIAEAHGELLTQFGPAQRRRAES